MSKDITFLVFYLVWANYKGWDVPLFHARMCEWLDNCNERIRVLMVFRGAAKSTIFAVYKAYQLFKDPTLKSIIYAADEDLSNKMTKDTLHVLMHHPLCIGMIPRKPKSLSFSVVGSDDARNDNISGTGANSNKTGSRANFADFDDIEVPKNIKTAEARLNLRFKIEDSTNILVKGWQKTFIGTPHTHDSIYVEQINAGAALLKIPLFNHAIRYEINEEENKLRFEFNFDTDDLYVVSGIHDFAKVLIKDVDYSIKDNAVILNHPVTGILDIYAGNNWEEMFTREEIEARRKQIRTIGGWDSQYMLEAKPITEIRLNPDRMIAYNVKPKISYANGQQIMTLGNVRIVGAVAYWDCALGKIKSDASAFCLVLTDEYGQLYWQVAEGLLGEVAVFNDNDTDIVGGQVYRIRKLVLEYHIPCVTIETNGVGGHVPPILKKALKGTGCSVVEHYAKGNKQERILDAFEAPLSSKYLWAHVDVLRSDAYGQMNDFNPDVRDQPDDYIDACAGAILQTPVRIGKVSGAYQEQNIAAWRPNSGTYEVELENERE